MRCSGKPDNQVMFWTCCPLCIPCCIIWTVTLLSLVISKARRCPWLLSTSKTRRSAMFSVTITTLRWTTLCTPPSPRGRKRAREGRRRGWPRQTSAHRATSSESPWALVGWGSAQVVDKHRHPLIEFFELCSGSLCTWTLLTICPSNFIQSLNDFQIFVLTFWFVIPCCICAITLKQVNLSDPTNLL